MFLHYSFYGLVCDIDKFAIIEHPMMRKIIIIIIVIIIISACYHFISNPS